DAIARDPAVRRWLRPRRSPAHAYRDGVVHRTAGAPIELTADEAAVFDRCDGHHRLHELPTEIVDRLAATGLVSIGFDLPMGERPELDLLGQLQLIPDESVRAPASR